MLRTNTNVRDSVAVLVLGVAGVAIALFHFSALRSTRGEAIITVGNMYGRSVVLAAGRGNASPDIEAIPGLKAFLCQETPSFDAEQIPAQFPLQEYSTEAYHRYLVLTVALLWRMFGISWRVVEALMAVFLGATAVLAYWGVSSRNEPTAERGVRRAVWFFSPHAGDAAGGP